MNASIYLRKGMKGSVVAKLQKLLNKVVSPSPKLKIDGDFGDNTLNTVLHFQRALKIKNVWAKHNKCTIFKPNDKTMEAVKGDIIVFNFSHIGIVESNNLSGIATIEGNTNAAGSREGITVARKIRSFGFVKAFIRLPMSTIGINHKDR